MTPPTDGFWLMLVQLLPEPVRASLLAFFLALLRVFYDAKEPQIVRRLLESSLCGLITYAVAYGCEAFGAPGGLSIFLGGAIGLFGADQVRVWGRKVAEQKIGD